MSIEITEAVARKVLAIVDAGLVKGVGSQKAGKMCVEAAVCYALDLPHSDDPPCVSRPLRELKINLNDLDWSSRMARSAGLRRLAVAQLGSHEYLDDMEFVKRAAKLAISTRVPQALRATASILTNPKHVQALRDVADACEREPTEANSRAAQKTANAAAYAANAAANAAAYAANGAANAAAYAANAANAAANAGAYAGAYAANAARDKSLADFAEGIVQILIEMKAPGCRWLPLTVIRARY